MGLGATPACLGMNTMDRLIAKSVLKDADVELMIVQSPAHAIGVALGRGIRHSPTCHSGRAPLSRPWMKRSREIQASSIAIRDKSCIVVGATRGIGLEVRLRHSIRHIRFVQLEGELKVLYRMFVLWRKSTCESKPFILLVKVPLPMPNIADGEENCFLCSSRSSSWGDRIRYMPQQGA